MEIERVRGGGEERRDGEIERERQAEERGRWRDRQDKCCKKDGALALRRRGEGGLVLKPDMMS